MSKFKQCKIAFSSNRGSITRTVFEFLNSDDFYIVEVPTIRVNDSEIITNFDYMVNVDNDPIVKVIERCIGSHRIIGIPYDGSNGMHVASKEINSVILKKYGIPTPACFSHIKFHGNTDAKSRTYADISRFIARNPDKDHDHFLFKPNCGSRGTRQFILNKDHIAMLNNNYIEEIIPDPDIIRINRFDSQPDFPSLCNDSSKCVNDGTIHEDVIEEKNRAKKYDDLCGILSLGNPSGYNLSELIPSEDRTEYRIILPYACKPVVVTRFKDSNRDWQFAESKDSISGFQMASHEYLFNEKCLPGFRKLMEDEKIPFLSIDFYTIGSMECGVFEIQMEFGYTRQKIDGDLVEFINHGMRNLIRDLRVKESKNDKV